MVNLNSIMGFNLLKMGKSVTRIPLPVASIIILAAVQLSVAKSAEEDFIVAIEKASLELPVDSFLHDTKLIQEVGKGQTTYKHLNGAKKGSTVFIRHEVDEGKAVVVLRSGEDRTAKTEQKRTFVVLRQDPSEKARYAIFYAYIRGASLNTPSEDVFRLENKNLTIEWDIWDHRGSQNLGRLFGSSACGRSLMTSCKLHAFEEGNTIEDSAQEAHAGEPDYSEENTGAKSIGRKLALKGNNKESKSDLFADLEVGEQQREFTAKTIRYIALAEAVLKSVRPSLKNVVEKLSPNIDWTGQLGLGHKEDAQKQKSKKGAALLKVPRDDVSRMIGQATDTFLAGVNEIAAAALTLTNKEDTNMKADDLYLLGIELLHDLMTTEPVVKQNIQSLSPNPAIFLQQKFVEAFAGKGPLVLLTSLAGKKEEETPLDEILDLEATAVLINTVLPKFSNTKDVEQPTKPQHVLLKFAATTKDFFRKHIMKHFVKNFHQHISTFGMKSLRWKRSSISERESAESKSGKGRGLLNSLFQTMKMPSSAADGLAADDEMGDPKIKNKGSKSKKKDSSEKHSKKKNSKEKNSKDKNSKDKNSKDKNSKEKIASNEIKQDGDPAEKRKREGPAAVPQLNTAQLQQAALIRALLLAQAQKRAAEMNQQSSQLQAQITVSGTTGAQAGQPQPQPVANAANSLNQELARQQLLSALIQADIKMRAEKQQAALSDSVGKLPESTGGAGGGLSGVTGMVPIPGVAESLNGILDSITGGDSNILNALISGADGGPNDVLNMVVGPGSEMVSGLIKGLNMDSLLGGIDGGLISGVLSGIMGSGGPMGKVKKVISGVVGKFMPGGGKGGDKKKGVGSTVNASTNMASKSTNMGTNYAAKSTGFAGSIMGSFMRSKRSVDDTLVGNGDQEAGDERYPRGLLGGLLHSKKKKTTVLSGEGKKASTEHDKEKESEKEQEGKGLEKEEEGEEGKGLENEEEGENGNPSTTEATPAIAHKAAEHKKKKLLGVLKLGKRAAPTKKTKTTTVKPKKSLKQIASSDEITTKKPKKPVKPIGSSEEITTKKPKKPKKKSSNSDSPESSESNSKEFVMPKSDPIPVKQKKKLGLLGLLGRRKRSFRGMVPRRKSFARRKRSRFHRNAALGPHVSLNTNQDLFSRVGWLTRNDMMEDATKDFSFFGWGQCKNANIAFDKVQKSAEAYTEFYLATLRMQCDPSKVKIVKKLREHELISFDDVGVFRISANKLKSKKKLSHVETEELSLAFEIAAFSQTYLELLLTKEPGMGPIKSYSAIDNNAHMLILFSHKYLSRVTEKAPAHLVMLQRNLVALLRTAIVRLVADYQKYAFENKSSKTKVFNNIFNLEGFVSFIMNGKDEDILANAHDSVKLFKLHLKKHSAAIEKAVIAYLGREEAGKQN